MRKFLVIYAVLVVFSSLALCDFPSNISRCRFSDLDCLTKAFNDVLKREKNGIKELNVPSFDPLKVPRIDIIQDATSNIAIKLVLNDADVYGISSANIYRLVGFDKDMSKSKFEINALIPKLEISSKYIVDGRVLILPITGNGNCQLILDNVDIKIKFKIDPFEKDGKVYGKIRKHKAQITTTRLTLRLDNLFNGNKALSDNMNKFLNENSEIIFDELKPAISAALGKVLSEVVGGVFETISYTDLFYE